MFLTRFSARLPMAAALVLAVPLAACSSENQLAIVSGDDRHVFEIELVDTPESRAQGLMFRESLAPNAGMLFDFFEERPVSFWMRNTLIPLDMLFIDDQGEIRTIHVNARPLDPTGIPSQVPVRFVLEIPGGRSQELGIEPGDTVEHPRVGSEPPPNAR
jgi:uncharacterized membrane protein (UPF0127 family)